MSDTKLAELTKKYFEADHSLGEVRAIKRVDAVGAYYSTLYLYPAHPYTVHRLAREESCLVDSLRSNIQEVVWENLLSILNHLYQLLFL